MGDGNVAIDNDLHDFSELFALPYEETWNGLSAACDEDFFETVGPTGIVEPFLASPDRTSKHCAATPYPAQRLASSLAQQGDEVKSTVMEMLRASFEEIGHGVYPTASVLMSCVASALKTGTFDGPGCCFKVPSDYAKYLDSFYNHLVPLDIYLTNNILSVRAVDVKNRLSPSAMARLWSRLMEDHPIGFMRASSSISIAAMPNLARPLPPFGSGLDRLTPLIVGNHGDAMTPYTSSRAMHSKFPNGALLSWQGYNHAMPRVNLTDPTSAAFYNSGYGADACASKMVKYLETGELPLNGDVCPINGPAASALGSDVAVQALDNGFCISKERDDPAKNSGLNRDPITLADCVANGLLPLECARKYG